VDDVVYAQPLYMANLSIGGGTHNTLFVATMNDSVYAFDADTCTQLWMVSLLNGGLPILPVDTDPANPGGPGGTNDIISNIGILGTPVIDPSTKTLYVISRMKDALGYHQHLHALALADGSEKTAFGSPVEISDAITVPGSGDTGDGTTCTATAGNVPFCPLHANQRPG